MLGICRRSEPLKQWCVHIRNGGCCCMAQDIAHLISSIEHGWMGGWLWMGGCNQGGGNYREKAEKKGSSSSSECVCGNECPESYWIYQDNDDKVRLIYSSVCVRVGVSECVRLDYRQLCSGLRHWASYPINFTYKLPQGFPTHLHPHTGDDIIRCS